MKLNKEYKTYVIVFFIVLLIGLLSVLEIYVCPLYYFTGIPCPSCGLTRAFLSLFHLNFIESFHYHALWPLVLISFIFYTYISIKRIKLNQKTINIICITLGIIFLGYYIYRHITGSPIVEIHFEESLLYKIYSFLFK